MDVVIICDLPLFNIKWLEKIYDILDNSTRIKFTIDYKSNNIFINLLSNINDKMYIKKCSSLKTIMKHIKKLNT